MAGTDPGWWQQEGREERLAELWPDRRRSASEIAAELGCTKNAAIAKAHRLGLGPRDPDYRSADAAPPQRNHFDGMGPGDCRFPIGNPGDEGFHFCGAPAMPERPYCGRHCAIAYIPQSRSKNLGAAWTDERRAKARLSLQRRLAAAE